MGTLISNNPCPELSHGLLSFKGQPRQHLALLGCQACSFLQRCFHIKTDLHEPHGIKSKPLALTHIVPCFPTDLMIDCHLGALYGLSYEA